MQIKEVYELIRDGKESYSSMGRKIGISDNGVRKRLKSAGFEPPKKIIGRVMFKCTDCSREFLGQNSRKKDSRTGKHFCNRECLYNYSRSNKDFNSSKK